MFNQLRLQMAKKIQEENAKYEANKAAELRRQQALAEQEAARIAAEAEKAIQEAEQKRLELEEKQRVNLLIEKAIQEANGSISGTVQMEAIFLEGEDIIAKFLATNPLEGALIANNLEAAKFLIAKGQRYDAWSDIIDEDTELYDLLNSASAKSSLSM